MAILSTPQTLSYYLFNIRLLTAKQNKVQAFSNLFFLKQKKSIIKKFFQKVGKKTTKSFAVCYKNVCVKVFRNREVITIEFI